MLMLLVSYIMVAEWILMLMLLGSYTMVDEWISMLILHISYIMVAECSTKVSSHFMKHLNVCYLDGVTEFLPHGIPSDSLFIKFYNKYLKRQ